jgi:multidrug efflux pump subunit AcrA (membrane-fusion protein)
MNIRLYLLTRWSTVGVIAAVVLVAVLVAGGLWCPVLRQWAASALGQETVAPGGAATCSGGDHEGHDHAAETAAKPAACEEDHDHEGEPCSAHEHAAEEDHKHVEADAVKLSRTAEENVGVRLAEVKLGAFERTIAVPAMVVGQPGRSAVQVAAPLTGVVTRIRPLQGETVSPGQPLFDLRLTHEEVVEGQAQYLRTAEELDVVHREIERLERVAADGAIAGKTLLERKYELQKLEGVFRAQRQGLLLHGLAPAQVDEIVAKRALVASMTVRAPCEEDCDPERLPTASPRLFQVEQLNVVQGQHVKAGDPLCTLADHSRLYIQGKAFEQDMPALEKAAAAEWRLTAVVEAAGEQRQKVPGLSIVYLSNKVEEQSRAFLFYVELPNRVLRNTVRPDGHRFTSWQFKPGQRVELLIPVERWTERIVLPLPAVVQDGAESYVFERNDGHFDRRSVRVEYRDQYSAVVANDGALQPGKKVAASGAYQLHLELKKKAGGAPDPHAGHNH